MRLLFIFVFLSVEMAAQSVHIRTNLVGYLPNDYKVGIVMHDRTIRDQAHLIQATTGNHVLDMNLTPVANPKWGSFQNQYLFNFSEVVEEGKYFIRVGTTISDTFHIKHKLYANHSEDLLAFMRQQRCGYNPYFDVVCHQGDGRTFYAPVPDSTYYDFSGGWHDAGDQLKYLITASNAVVRMLLAFELSPEIFEDLLDDLGHPNPNGISDVLDEAKWGLDWILKLHPQADWLIHQIADDRDHRGFKFPHKDNAEYGWGPNSYRAAYFASGQPQGLGKWKSKATGIANLAGRSAAALALGAHTWRLQNQSVFAEKCKIAAIELYNLGKEQQGYQQGNSFGAPYRYNEDTWADDMELAACSLYKLTGQTEYLKDAIDFAFITKDEGWMAMDSMEHYQKYPFMNLGHFLLHDLAHGAVKDSLEQWYRQNIQKVVDRSNTNAFQIGVPFLWCSNNLMVNFITQVQLYEKMTGDDQFHDVMLLHRDWLFGRNPWGSSMFTGIPKYGETPLDVHIPPRALLKDTPAGGLVDGPIYASIFSQLKGLVLFEPDEFAQFQNDFVVYHDDIGDYSTNEPTMDGTADSILMFAIMGLNN